MPRTRIKICGITQIGDAWDAVYLEADFVGLNMFRGPRKISDDTFTQIFWGLRDEDSPVTRRVDLVALVAADELLADRTRLNIPYGMDAYQLYGKDLSEAARSPLLTNRWWMPVQIDSRAAIVDAAVAVAMLPAPPAALLLDTASPTHLGGTGQSFNWHWIAEARAAGELDGLPPIILAGGLNPDNVADAIRIARPYAVDVSSGVEFPGQPGIKDPFKMRDFIQAVHAADAALSD
jgi:phosphoribosylanthranilate isomerase